MTAGEVAAFEAKYGYKVSSSILWSGNRVNDIRKHDRHAASNPLQHRHIHARRSKNEALVLDDSVHFKGIISGFEKVSTSETIDTAAMVKIWSV